MIGDPASRFSTRVENYVKYRPSYPPAVVASLRDECALTPASIVADVGSGTGILSELFLRNGNTVFGVEPNAEMRAAGKRLLSSYDNFVSVDGRSEATTLESGSVDFITAGQAFHWFDPIPTRAEFARILKPGGWVVVVWNDRLIEGIPFLEEYERFLLEHGTDYQDVSNKYTEATLIAPFFEGHEVKKQTFNNNQVFDYAGLEGRLRSASYTPEPDSPKFVPMMDALKRLFEKHQTDKRIEIAYITKLFYGHLD